MFANPLFTFALCVFSLADGEDGYVFTGGASYIELGDAVEKKRIWKEIGVGERSAIFAAYRAKHAADESSSKCSKCHQLKDERRIAVALGICSNQSSWDGVFCFIFPRFNASYTESNADGVTHKAYCGGTCLQPDSCGHADHKPSAPKKKATEPVRIAPPRAPSMRLTIARNRRSSEPI